MEDIRIEAVYENGTFKLARKLPLEEGQKVTITIQPAAGAVERMYGMLAWDRDPEELRRFLNDADEGQWGNRDL